MSDLSTLGVRRLGLMDYEPVWRAMQTFTDQRDEDTPDELWLVEHPPVFTQGQAGRAEHILAPGDIPVIQVDRGGQVTYHGPGQIVAYPLIDIGRLELGVRKLVTGIEQVIIDVLQSYGVDAQLLVEAHRACISTVLKSLHWVCGFARVNLSMVCHLTSIWIWNPFSALTPVAMKVCKLLTYQLLRKFPYVK